MKKHILSVSMIGLLSFVSGSALAEPMYGILMVVKGTVKVQTTSKQISNAKVGSKVQEGDSVITEADSRAKIVMSDRNVINLNPDTQIVIAKYENDAASGKKNVELNLLKGKVRNNVEQTYDGEKNKFLIKTPTAVAGVRGTQFLAGFNPQTQMTSIVTFKGSVSLASIGANGKMIGSPVMVKKGEMTQSAPNTAPEAPKILPKEDMKKMDGDSTASMQNKETNTTSGDQKREVASDGAGTQEPASLAPQAAPMVDSKDMDTGMAKEIKDVRAPNLAPPTAVTGPTPPPKSATDSLVKGIVRDAAGKTKVIVRPVPQN
jgi:hypothetical protein